MKELKKYLITDPEYYSNNPIEFEKILTQALTKQHMSDVVKMDIADKKRKDVKTLKGPKS